MTLVGFFLLGAAILALAYGVVARRAPDGRSATAYLWASVFVATGFVWGWCEAETGPCVDVVSPLTLWIVSVSFIVGSFIVAEGVIEHRCAWKLLRGSPERVGEFSLRWAAFDESCTALGLLLLLGVFAQLSLGMKTHWAGERLIAALLGACSFVVGIALLRLVTRRWCIGLADVGLALLSVGVATLLLVCLPASPATLAERFPARFNTILVGLTVMIWFWAWLYAVWEQQLDDSLADDSGAWTTAGRLRSRIPRLIVALAVVGLVAAGMMSVWPQLNLMGTYDASFLRIGFGVAGHLFLILALVTLGRRWRHAPLAILGGAGAISLCIFLLIRLSAFSEIKT